MPYADRKKRLAYHRVYNHSQLEKNRDRARKWAQDNPERAKARNLKKYHFTIEIYDRMFASQDGLCAICGIHASEAPKQKLYSDHNHITKLPRGLLCSNCNAGLGFFKDSTDALEKAKAYLIERGSYASTS